MATLKTTAAMEAVYALWDDLDQFPPSLLIGDKPLSPVARRVLQKLLTGMSEKEIAESLGQTVPTTHKYVKTIYERFGVNGRAALMSLCLRN